MTRWGIVAIAVLALAGCKKSAPKESCEPTAKPSPEWAYQEHLAAGGAKVELPAKLEVAERTDYKALYELRYTQGDEQPYPLLGRAWKCKLYSDGRALAKVLLVDEGWAAATPEARTTLAHTLYTKLWGSLSKPDLNWNAATTFAPPELTALPDGGVKLLHWRADYKPMDGMRDGMQRYVWETVTFAPDGSVSEPKTLARD